ncbi:MAG: hypothetical protein J6Y58_02860, partial [Clostridiales bacterium]|nr:hypothetical protein [Clostridiales bacterium]
MKNRKALKLVATLISMALMVPMAGCSRNSASEKQGGTQVAARDRKEAVAESDPYFYITEKELSIPVEKNRKVVYADLGECRFVGDQVFVSYMLF